MKRIPVFILCLLFATALAAQTPSSFRYQAVARNNSGNVLVNQNVSFRISILSGSAAGATAYSETHAGKTTNAFGLVEIEIGKGTPVTGTFSSINWGNNSFFVKVEMDPAGGNTYQTISTSQLLSVAYALHAKTVESGDNWGNQSVNSNATITGNGTVSNPLGIADNGVNSAKILDGSVATSDLANNAVTSLKIADGTIATADVANSAVTTDKLGDLAVNAAKLQNSAVTSDKLATNSVTEAKIAAGAVTGAKIAQGGATSGQALKWNGTSWAPGNDELGGLTLPFEGTANSAMFSSAFKVINAGENTYTITAHATNTSGSARAFYGISDAHDGIGIQGYVTHKTGYSQGVSGLSESSGGVGVFGRASSTTGETVGVIGRSESTAGTGVFGVASTFTGTNYGVQGRSSSTSGTGVQGEATATSGSTFGVTGRSSSPSGAGVFGTSSATTGSAWGVFGSSGSTSGRGIGARAYSPTGTTYGIHAEVLSNNGFSGYFTGGKFFVSGNVGIGTETPEYRLDVRAPNGVVSTGLAIFQNSSGDPKVQIRQNSNGAGAVYVYKDGGGVQTVALFGEGNSYITGGNLGIGTNAPTQALHVVGNVRVSAIGSGLYLGPVNRSLDGTFTTSTSDIRLKENIETINDGLNKVMQLRGVTFSWKSNPELGNRIGFIAQEMEQVIPELVFTNDVDGFKGINYAEATAVLVEAIKELKAENDRLKAENDKVNQRLEKIEALLNATVKD